MKQKSKNESKFLFHPIALPSDTEQINILYSKTVKWQTIDKRRIKLFIQFTY